MKRIFISGLLLSFIACSGPADEDITLRLTSKERRAIDTLVANQVEIIRPRYDSICAADFDKMVDLAVDSIVQRRLEEEARLRARIPMDQKRGI